MRRYKHNERCKKVEGETGDVFEKKRKLDIHILCLYYTVIGKRSKSLDTDLNLLSDEMILTTNASLNPRGTGKIISAQYRSFRREQIRSRYYVPALQLPVETMYSLRTSQLRDMEPGGGNPLFYIKPNANVCNFN